MKYFYEVFESVQRQGPGSNKYTKKAYDMIKGYLPEHPKILDIGCGKGTQTFKLAEISNGQITAIDNHQPFVDFINNKAADEYLEDTVKAENRDMASLSLPEGRFDVLWAEGSIYNIGFEKGLTELKKYVKNAGFMVVSESVWLKDNQPEELKNFWDNGYKDIDTIENKLKIIEKAELKIIQNFTLPEDGWTNFFYGPLQEAIDQLREKNKDVAEALKTYDNLQNEIDMFNKYKEYYSYQYFVLKKL